MALIVTLNSPPSSPPKLGLECKRCREKEGRGEGWVKRVECGGGEVVEELIEPNNDDI